MDTVRGEGLDVSAEPPAAKKRKGGWPKGKPRPKAAKATAAPSEAPSARDRKAMLAALAETIANYHETAALFTGLEELKLSRAPKDEALILAEGWSKLQSQYSIKIPEKVEAVLTMVAALSIVYMPKLSAIGQRAKLAKARKTAEQTPPAPPPRPQPSRTEPAAETATGRETMPATEIRGTRDFIFATGRPDGGKIRFQE